MATTVINKGGIVEKGTYRLVFGTVNTDGGGAAYATDDFNIIEILENVEIQSQVQAVKIGGGLVPRNDYTQKTGSITLEVHLPYGGPLSVGKEGLPVKLTRQTWNDLTVTAIALEGALLSRRETGRNGASVMEQLTIDLNPHWLVEATV